MQFLEEERQLYSSSKVLELFHRFPQAMEPTHQDQEYQEIPNHTNLDNIVVSTNGESSERKIVQVERINNDIPGRGSRINGEGQRSYLGSGTALKDSSQIVVSLSKGSLTFGMQFQLLQGRRRNNGRGHSMRMWFLLRNWYCRVITLNLMASI